MVRTDPGTLSDNYCRMNRQDWQSATAVDTDLARAFIDGIEESQR
jgi:hypothetical protein